MVVNNEDRTRHFYSQKEVCNGLDQGIWSYYCKAFRAASGHSYENYSQSSTPLPQGDKYKRACG